MLLGDDRWCIPGDAELVCRHFLDVIWRSGFLIRSIQSNPIQFMSFHCAHFSFVLFGCVSSICFSLSFWSVCVSILWFVSSFADLDVKMRQASFVGVFPPSRDKSMQPSYAISPILDLILPPAWAALECPDPTDAWQINTLRTFTDVHRVFIGSVSILHKLLQASRETGETASLINLSIRTYLHIWCLVFRIWGFMVWARDFLACIPAKIQEPANFAMFIKFPD